MTDDKWALYNVGAAIPGASGFHLTVFDGRHMYFIPNGEGTSGLVTRFDTKASFGSKDSWSTFDLAIVNGAATGYVGGAFDGRYIYFVPHHNPTGYHGTIARYDTQSDFNSNSAWATYDLSSVKSGFKGFATAAFDGRYLYLTPHHHATDYSGLVARFDTTAEFTKSESWTAFDVATVDASARGFLGSAFDGRYLYLIPHVTAPNALSGTVARFDTKAAGGFTEKASWRTFHTESLHGAPVGFWGTVFDGRYLYMAQDRAPNPDPATGTHAGGWVARYDTQADFNNPSSWLTFDVSGTAFNPARGFAGAIFDGRFVYLVPFQNDVTKAPEYDGIVAQYDTTARFDVPSSWKFFDLATKDPNAIGFAGAGFDGQYVYLAPRINAQGQRNGIVARFDAKSPPWLPVGWNRTFP